MAVRTLTNVLIPAGEWEILPARIRFDGQIRDIRPLSGKPVHWDEIDSAAKWQTFFTRFSAAPAGGDFIDGRFLLLIPGAVDPHVHFNTPGFEAREDIEHGSAAAAAGGVTCVIDMPCTSLPPVTSPESLRNKQQIIAGRSRIDYALWGGISGQMLRKPQPLKQTVAELGAGGVAGFKAYLLSGMDSFPDLSEREMQQAAEAVRPTGLPLAVHAEDKGRVTARRREAQQKGETGWQAYCRARDIEAETMAVRRMVKIAGQTGCRIHIVHLSSAQGLELVRQAQADGLPLTAETCPHYLYFTLKDFEKPALRNYLKTAPPVKSEADRRALWEGLRDGSLRFVTTDHAGCDPESEKSAANFWDVYGGIPGVEHRVPFLFSEGFLKKRISLQRTVELLSGNAADFFGLAPRKGHLRPGGDADFALLNLWEPYTVSAGGMHSKGKYTPFEGVRFSARVEQTWLRGKPVFDRRKDGLTVTADGQFLEVNLNRGGN